MFQIINLKKVRKILKIIFWLIFFVYFCYMLYILFLGRYRIPATQENYNIIPFKTIKMYIDYYDHFNFTIWFSNLFGNVLAFMPLGFLAPLLIKRLNGFLKVLFLSFFTTVIVESIQLTYHVGGFDVDDIILNTIGGVLGYLVFLLVYTNIKSLSKGHTEFTNIR
ncbi:VanZ family protein [Heyndrickxia sporothermodurans]|uniref:VanZ family protein n=1 Tax=Heyndrickxia sporothermodurans TaxID=46224 RepID=A0A150L9B0_9BACI|nr:VanZ family protein [Heyndrickxia sporothermodurans]KYD08609.1 hypothetical protein B4102_0689 [Heyndrickxia sporothermodurans]MBL5766897.1 VanZ family protein [Heyndrickxia sporothermodurans]MBL5771115.1 VanZ family protein [Heyndrickxia sporothermodurans]MBL5773895.1 VanZ family protein [Heyndrickxia sporothermodurans]MBL5778274.1 VanZ family protein [Heyndrickxia sporothermodurans]